ncbi:hypothetical protein ACO0QE_001085 [Hanseniaspora vineae]
MEKPDSILPASENVDVVEKKDQQPVLVENQDKVKTENQKMQKDDQETVQLEHQETLESEKTENGNANVLDAADPSALAPVPGVAEQTPQLPVNIKLEDIAALDDDINADNGKLEGTKEKVDTEQSANTRSNFSPNSSSSSSEYESSDAESSSDSNSNSSSDEDSDDESSDSKRSRAGNDEEDVGDEDDEPLSGPIRSTNELAEEPIPEIPEDLQVGPSTKVQLIGHIKSCFENNVIIQATNSAEQRVLKDGSMLCLEDKSVLGPLCEVFGPLQQPFYRVIIPKEKSELLTNLKNNEIGKPVFLITQVAHWIDTFELKKLKGSDASNFCDEEVEEMEQEFSDDEKEAAYKKQLKEKKNGNKKKPQKVKKSNANNKVKKPQQYDRSKNQTRQDSKSIAAAKIPYNSLPQARVPSALKTGVYQSRDSRYSEKNNQVSSQPALVHSYQQRMAPYNAYLHQQQPQQQHQPQPVGQQYANQYYNYQQYQQYQAPQQNNMAQMNFQQYPQMQQQPTQQYSPAPSQQQMMYQHMPNNQYGQFQYSAQYQPQQSYNQYNAYNQGYGNAQGYGNQQSSPSSYPQQQAQQQFPPQQSPPPPPPPPPQPQQQQQPSQAIPPDIQQVLNLQQYFNHHGSKNEKSGSKPKPDGKNDLPNY